MNDSVKKSGNGKYGWVSILATKATIPMLFLVFTFPLFWKADLASVVVQIAIVVCFLVAIIFSVLIVRFEHYEKIIGDMTRENEKCTKHYEEIIASLKRDVKFYSDLARQAHHAEMDTVERYTNGKFPSSIAESKYSADSAGGTQDLNDREIL